jgi:hypothetical protein
MYLELAKRMGTPIDEIVFLYELKADQDYREFSIKADYEIVKPIFDKAKQVVDAVIAQTPIACNNNEAGCKSCLQFGENDDA